MLQNFLSNKTKNQPDLVRGRWWLVILLPLWVVVGFFCAQIILGAILWAMQASGLTIFNELNNSIKQTVVAACVYLLTLVIVMGVPWLAKKKKTSLQDIGLTSLPTWLDIGFAPVGFVLYLLTSGIAVYLFGMLVPSFDMSQAQNVGFVDLSQQYEYILAFATLVVIAPVAEEILFRGYLYGKLRRWAPLWVAMVVSSALFGAVHGQWNVAIDVFVLGMVACGLREVTGSIWAGVLLHVIKNGLAFYFLFINTSFLVQ